MHTPGAPRAQSKLLEKDLFVQPLPHLTVQPAVLSVFLSQSCVNISTTSSESDFPERRPEDSGGVGRDPAQAASRTRGFYSGLALEDSGQDPGPPASLCPCRKGGRERLRPQSAQDRFPACCWPGAGGCVRPFQDGWSWTCYTLGVSRGLWSLLGPLWATGKDSGSGTSWLSLPRPGQS